MGSRFQFAFFPIFIIFYSLSFPKYYTEKKAKKIIHPQFSSPEPTFLLVSTSSFSLLTKKNVDSRDEIDSPSTSFIPSLPSNYPPSSNFLPFSSLSFSLFHFLSILFSFPFFSFLLYFHFTLFLAIISLPFLIFSCLYWNRPLPPQKKNNIRLIPSLSSLQEYDVISTQPPKTVKLFASKILVRRMWRVPRHVTPDMTSSFWLHRNTSATTTEYGNLYLTTLACHGLTVLFISR